MQGNLNANDIQLIANLINDKYESLTIHVSNEIRMVKLTVQENHKVSVEARDQAKLTNGRVNKLENEMYGEYNPKDNKPIKGKEGALFYLEEVKKLRFTYKTWRHVAITLLILSAFFIKESREMILAKFMNFKI